MFLYRLAAVITFFSGVPLLECCRVDDKLSAVVQAEWILMLADCRSASIPVSQVVLPKETWSEVVEKECQTQQLNKTVAVDCSM